MKIKCTFHIAIAFILIQLTDEFSIAFAYGICEKNPYVRILYVTFAILSLLTMIYLYTKYIIRIQMQDLFLGMPLPKKKWCITAVLMPVLICLFYIFFTKGTFEKGNLTYKEIIDVAEALGYSNTKDAIATHVASEDKKLIQRSEITTLEIPNRGMTIINESGLYALILSSKLPSAKEFKHWVTAEVLPSIRKTGGYVNPSQSDLFLDTYLPFADQNTRLLFKTTLDTIQQQNNTIQQQNHTISHQEDIIRNLTSDIPLADKRQILNRIVRFGGSPHTRWPFLYREFDNKFHMNTKVQLEHYNETHKPKLQNRLDYIEHIGMFNDLAEIACVIFGPDIEKLSAQYYEICK